MKTSTLTLGLFLLFQGLSRAADATAEKRVALGKSFSPAGALVRREAPGKPWQSVAMAEDVFSGDLLLALPLAALNIKSGMHLLMTADLDGRAPFPAVESALVLHDNPDVDLDFTLDRGRVAFANHKNKGQAKVKMRFRDQVWELTLTEPKTRVGVEIYGRWPAGIPFSKEPKPDQVPSLDLVLLVFHGQATLKTGAEEYLLRAPPGQALFQWDSVAGADPSPRPLAKLPSWAGDEDGKAAPLPFKKKLARNERFRQLVKGNSVGAAIDDFINSDEEDRRRLAVYAMGATDDLGRLCQVLTQPKHPDDWETAVKALRHWLGRCPGQDILFYDYLVKELKFTPAHADIVLQLAHSFGEQDRARPALYEMLIDYLRHDQLLIRGLSYWHLYRLAAAGRKIPFNPAAGGEEREKAYQAWKKLIPNGQMPPRNETEGK